MTRKSLAETYADYCEPWVIEILYADGIYVEGEELDLLCLKIGKVLADKAERYWEDEEKSGFVGEPGDEDLDEEDYEEDDSEDPFDDES